MEYGYRSSIKQVEERGKGLIYGYIDIDRSSIKQVEERGKGLIYGILI